VPVGRRISVDGGLTRSAYFLQFLANALQRDVVCPEFDEITAFGCAAMAAGGDVVQADKAFVVSPNVKNVADWHDVFGEAVRRSKGWR